jgi:putative hydrolase of HD superfamily
MIELRSDPTAECAARGAVGEREEYTGGMRDSPETETQRTLRAMSQSPASDLAGILEFLRAAERLKVTFRSAYTSAGRPESVAEHTWRLCLMALVLAPEFPGVDFSRLVKICLVHDLGEAIGGDVSAPEQARRTRAGLDTGKGEPERRDLLTLLEPLPDRLRREITALWDDYDAAASREAKLAKALDKLETILQHNQGHNPPDFDYRFNLEYGRVHTAGEPLIAAVRAILDEETEQRARDADEWRRPPPA